MKFLRCAKCGKILGVIQDSGCGTVCCGSEMKEMIAGTSDGAAEKHVPQVIVEGKTVTVDVGEVSHPMVDAHSIEWVTIQTKEGAQRKLLKPGTEPKAVFQLTDSDELVAAYSYCNLHGLWKADL